MLDFSALDQRLSDLTPRRDSSSSASTSSSNRPSLTARSKRTLGIQQSDPVQPLEPSINPRAVQQEFEHVCLGCIRQLTSRGCFDAFSSAEKPTVFRFNQEIESLQDSASCCFLCAEIHQLFLFFWAHKDEGDWDVVSVFLEPQLDDDSAFIGLAIHVIPVDELPREFVYLDSQIGEFWIHTAEGEISNAGMPLPSVQMLIAISEDQASAQVGPREINHKVTSPAALDKARHWLKRCAQIHSACRPHGSGSLPTRLLDISTDKPRLRQTEGLGLISYAALSYCWGPSSLQPNLLTTQRIDDYNAGIEIGHLPRTLRDAISVAQDLGFDYLWIDSACIIQDDEDDKRAEIAKIRTIFANSFLTIVASTADTADSGFLQNRDPPPSAMRLPFPCANGSVGSVYLRGKISTGWIQYDPDQFATESRAWTMEEKLLSPRVLMYTDRQLRWICNTTVDCDGGHIDSHPRRITNQPGQALDVPIGASPDRLDEYLQNQSGTSKNDNSGSFQHAWSILVTCYTRRHVTNVKDRLRAIGGIADQFASLSQYQYLAGLWRETLGYDLLWTEANPARLLSGGWNQYTSDDPSSFWRHIKQPTAPSWSWASVHYPITAWIHGDINFQDFEIRSCNVVLQSDIRPFGEVLQGSLTLRAKTSIASICGAKLQIPLKLAPHEAIDEDSRYHTCGIAQIDSSRPLPGKPADVPVDRFRLSMLLLKFGTFGDAAEDVGLLLSRVEPRPGLPDVDCYQRMGTFTVYSAQNYTLNGKRLSYAPAFADTRDITVV